MAYEIGTSKEGIIISDIRDMRQAKREYKRASKYLLDPIHIYRVFPNGDKIEMIVEGG
jgi:hypothetical protein